MVIKSSELWEHQRVEQKRGENRQRSLFNPGTFPLGPQKYEKMPVIHITGFTNTTFAFAALFPSTLCFLVLLIINFGPFHKSVRSIIGISGRKLEKSQIKAVDLQ